MPPDVGALELRTTDKGIEAMPLPLCFAITLCEETGFGTIDMAARRSQKKLPERGAPLDDLTLRVPSNQHALN